MGQAEGAERGDEKVIFHCARHHSDNRTRRLYPSKPSSGCIRRTRRLLSTARAIIRLYPSTACPSVRTRRTINLLPLIAARAIFPKSPIRGPAKPNALVLAVQRNVRSHSMSPTIPLARPRHTHEYSLMQSCGVDRLERRGADRRILRTPGPKREFGVKITRQTRRPPPPLPNPTYPAIPTGGTRSGHARRVSPKRVGGFVECKLHDGGPAPVCHRTDEFPHEPGRPDKDTCLNRSAQARQTAHCHRHCRASPAPPDASRRLDRR